MPHTNRRYSAIAIAAVIAIAVSFAFAANRQSTRRDELRRALIVQKHEDAKLCRDSHLFAGILVVQLKGALARLNASVNKKSPVYRQQRRVLMLGINQLSHINCGS